MVAGLAFLSKKAFNPRNLSNQKTVWEAQQEKKNEAKRLKQREDELKRERDHEELARARDGERGGDRAKLKFMYDAPPGATTNNNKMEEDEGERKKPATTTTTNGAGIISAERQAGDDDAAAAFRQMLAAASNPQTDAATTTTSTTTIQDSIAFSDNGGASLTGTNIDSADSNNKKNSQQHLSALEKAVGRRDGNNSSMTLEEQIARFPQLKNAPMAKGMTATNVNVTFKPLGTQLRNVKCFACGLYGHSKGDRECSMSGWDPFSASNRPSVAVNVERSAGANSAVALKPSANALSSDVPDNDRKQSAQRNYYSSDDSSSMDSSEESRRRRRRKRHRKKHKSRKHESKRKRRSYSSDHYEDEKRRKKSSHHKRRKKHHSKRHDDD